MQEVGVLKLGSVSIDGTKMKANVSKHSALSYGYASKLEEQLAAEVAELLKKAESADQSALPDGMSMPAELARREERLLAIAGAKAEIERRAKERYAREREAYEKKTAGRKHKSTPPSTNDKKELMTALDSITSLPGNLGSVNALLTDSGYFSEGNAIACEEEKITPYIAPDREGHGAKKQHG